VSDSVINARAVSAPGVFAPGHLGELTRQVPPELVDVVLAETNATEQRARLLPARVVVYLLLAGALFEHAGWRQVWARLVAGLPGKFTTPSSPAISQAMARLGVAPLRALFTLLAGPAATTAAVRFGGLLVVAIDGTRVSIPDTAANLTRFTKHSCQGGGGGYPAVRLVALVACGTRSIIDAVMGPTSTGETTYAPGLLRSLRAGMLLLGDRNFPVTSLLTGVAATGAHFLMRVKTGGRPVRLPVLRRHNDGSFVSRLGTLNVRVIEAQITTHTPGGSRTGLYRLITTLTDPDRYPATDLVGLYHQRWEIETTYYELKSSILHGRVLRSRTPDGVLQEIYALLTCYQILRTAMTDATNTDPGLDPDRASFTIALNTARDQVVRATGLTDQHDIDLVGTIGQEVLNNLLPDRRPRLNARTVKRALSKYHATGPDIDRHTYPTTLTITILTEGLTSSPEP
jgi:hypothetical protein